MKLKFFTMQGREELVRSGKTQDKPLKCFIRCYGSGNLKKFIEAFIRSMFLCIYLDSDLHF